MAQKSRKYTTPKLNFDILHWCELLYYPAILHLFRHSKRRLKLLPAQNARNYTTPKPHSRKPPFPEVLLPYEFTLLQNLKRGLKLLPVHISQGFSITFYHITFLLSEGHIDYYTCANLFNYPAILYLSKCSNRHLKLLPAQKSHKYTTPKPFTIWYSRNLLFYYPMNLHYSKTNVDNTVYHMRFYYRMNLHYSKTSKEDWSCYQCMHHKAFQLHFIISLPFCQKKHIDYHTCANLFNYPAILHLSKCSNRHLKLLPAQNARKYTTPKPILFPKFVWY